MNLKLIFSKADVYKNGTISITNLIKVLKEDEDIYYNLDISIFISLFDKINKDENGRVT